MFDSPDGRLFKAFDDLDRHGCGFLSTDDSNVLDSEIRRSRAG
jgi:hypothetical protein